ncbi:MAG: glycosyltransferase family 2 protein [Spirochaetes bacterium]|nr:glycosyltransferase family 2 protein [Spirochaetota bacterium]
MKKKPVYSVIVPVYNEEEVIAVSYRKLKDTMDYIKEDYELIFINDGSKDKTMNKLLTAAQKDKHVKIIDFSRNFGHQIAISAGMDYCIGDAVIVIDADLQDPPEVIEEMIKKWKQGYHVVYGKRKERKGESFFKKITAGIFYRLLNKLTDVHVPEDVGDFRLIDRKVCDEMKKISEKNRYVRGLIAWLGFNQTEVSYIREKRAAGKTKYPLKKMIKFASNAIISFSYKPLKTATFLGSLISLVGVGYLLYIMYLKFFTNKTVQGWTSSVSINLIFFGIILFILGIMGEYIGRIYDEIKNRPLYIIKDLIGFEEIKKVKKE